MAEKCKALEEAMLLAKGDRQEAYGGLDENFGRIRAMLTLMAPHLSSLTEADIQLVNVATKLSRNAEKYKRDNIVDCINYLDFYTAFKEEEKLDSEFQTERWYCSICGYEKIIRKGDKAEKLCPSCPGLMQSK